ncbi:MAG: hypothetical protein GWP91_02600 [Rhodobacterales bacterium]|nr:hypothetical protein [Rhodobacterales bacterium]
MTWEALRVRTLYVGGVRAGFGIVDIHDALRLLHISSNKDFSKAFKALTAVDMDHIKGEAKRAWTGLCEMEKVRHQVVHGFRRVGDDYLDDCSRILEGIFGGRAHLLGAIPVTGPDGIERQIGDPLRTRPRDHVGPKKTHGYEEVLNRLVQGMGRKDPRGANQKKQEARLRLPRSTRIQSLKRRFQGTTE